jgi:general secretion pathway protein F
MAVFTYKATDATLADLSGTIAADTPRQARDLLRDRGLVVRDLLNFTPARTSQRRRLRLREFFPTVRRSHRHLSTDFLRELSTLLGVGVPLLESLDTLAKQHAAGRFNSVIVLLRDRVAGGASLAQAMREQPDTFDELTISITEVGEDAGTLDVSLERLAEFRERSQQLRGRLSTALIYPTIVLTLAIFASVFLMTFVVPRILEPLIEQGQPLPLPTKIVKSFSDFLLSWGWLLALIVACVVASFSMILRTPRGKLAAHRALLKLPLIGELARKQAIVRIAVVVSTLLKSGIVFVRAVQIAQRTTANLVLRDALKRVEDAIAAGADIGEALDKTGAFAPMVVQVFALGQQSGRLEEMLDRLAGVYDLQVSNSAQRLAAILEPLLIIVLAMIVLFIVMATVLPILEAGNAIQ